MRKHVMPRCALAALASLVIALPMSTISFCAQKRNETRSLVSLSKHAQGKKKERDPAGHATRSLECGVASDSSLPTANSGSTIQITEGATTSPPPIRPVLGPQNTLFILFNFLDNPITPITREDMYAAAFTDARGVASFYATTSYGKLSVTGDVAGWFTISYYENGTCDSGSWRNAARAAASAAGYELTRYTHFVYVWPQNNPSTGVQSYGCGWAGFSAGTDSHVNAWVNPNGYFYDGYQGHQPDQLIAIICHEFGNGLGMASHAATLRCDDGKRAIDNYSYCTPLLTGDFDDVMAYVNPAHELNAPHRAMMGWFDNNQVKDVTSNGTYLISPLEYRDGNVKALRIKKADTNEFYYLSYRLRSGPFDSYISASDGVTVHVWDGYVGTATRGIYVSPWTAASAYSAAPSALLDGMRFEDSSNGLQVTQVAHNANGVTLTINFGRIRCQSTNPLVRAFMGAGGVVNANAGYYSQPFSLLVYNNSAVACGASSFTVGSAGPSGWSTAYSGSVRSVQAQSYVLLNDQVQTSASSPAGDYSFTVTATRTDAPAYTASAGGSVRVTGTDVTPPTPPTNLTAMANGTSVSLSWAASTDNIAVTSYTILRNDNTAGGSTPFTTVSTSYVDTGTDPTHIYTYSVYATDLSGLLSNPTSVRASATMPIIDITSPGNGSSVSGVVPVGVAVSDNQGIAKVELYVDNQLTSTSTNPPFTTSWDAGRKVSAGAHSLQCKAYDVAGHVGASAVVQVTK